MTYEEFDGSKEYSFQIKGNQKHIISISVVTETGSINVWIAKDGDSKNAVYERNDIQMSSFAITIHEAGKYIIHLDANSHHGNYLFTWK
jgi:hypothetical protein